MGSVTLSPIGFIRTPYKEKSEAPHQPDPKEGVAGVIELLPNNNFEQAVEDLEGVEKLWIIYWFDRNQNWKPKVRVPRGEAKKRGVFATRSPHRPNPLGLTLVDLVRVDGRTLHVRNLDLLDGTPVLDIKPYLPALEAYPSAKAGWIDAVESEHAQPSYAVTFLPLAEAQLELLRGFGLNVKSVALRVLQFHAQPHPYKRIDRDTEGLYLAWRAWRVRFTLDGSKVVVTEIRSGYSRKAVTSSESLSDDEAQRVFIAQFPESVST